MWTRSGWPRMFKIMWPLTYGLLALQISHLGLWQQPTITRTYWRKLSWTLWPTLREPPDLVMQLLIKAGFLNKFFPCLNIYTDFCENILLNVFLAPQIINCSQIPSTSCMFYICHKCACFETLCVCVHACVCVSASFVCLWMDSHACYYCHEPSLASFWASSSRQCPFPLQAPPQVAVWWLTKVANEATLGVDMGGLFPEPAKQSCGWCLHQWRSYARMLSRHPIFCQGCLP